MAQWAEEAKRRHVKAISRQLYREDTLLSLSDMMNLNIRNISDKDGVYIRSTKAKGNKEGVLFLSGNNLVNVFYVQAVSLVGFLVEKIRRVEFY